MRAFTRARRRAAVLLAALPLALGGCAWVSNAEYKALSDRDGDGLDWQDDCDDEDASVGAAPTWYADLDGDGYGDEAVTLRSCGQPDQASAVAGDCDDRDATVSPAAAEVWYDGLDEACDGGDDDDADGDGYRSAAEGGDDCDDADPATHPGAVDGYYDGVDRDCDGSTDGDLDGDGFDAAIVGGADCDDDAAEVNPDAEEIWYDGVDQDCDGEDGDGDGDGFDAAAVGGADCDDGDAAVSPAAEEICDDGVDNDCDGLANCARSGALSLSDADLALTGESVDDQAGTWLAGLGDFDGDGLEDLIIGAPTVDRGGTAAGAAYVVVGPATASAALGGALAILVGDRAADNAGQAVAGPGDLDGDGFADALVGALRQDSNGAESGAAYLVYGPVSGEAELNRSDAVVLGDSAGDLAGVAVSGAGDVDGDGQPDLLIGANQSNLGATDAGAAVLVTDPLDGSVNFSAAGVVWTGASASEVAGAAVAGLGDLDGDGLADVGVSAPYAAAGGTRRGTVYVLLGPAGGGGALSAADALLLGDADGDNAGAGLSGAGDCNGDGYDDVIVGAPYNDEGAANGGLAAVLLGPVGGSLSLVNADARLLGDAIGDQAGSAVAGGVDQDGDGVGDLWVGVPEDDGVGAAAGAAILFYGPIGDVGVVSLSLAAGDASFGGVKASNYAGAALAAAGDLNGDGRDDLAIGAYGYDSYRGAVYLLLGRGL